jgi:hypothetical protein
MAAGTFHCYLLACDIDSDSDTAICVIVEFTEKGVISFRRNANSWNVSGCGNVEGHSLSRLLGIP